MTKTDKVVEYQLWAKGKQLREDLMKALLDSWHHRFGLVRYPSEKDLKEWGRNDPN